MLHPEFAHGTADDTIYHACELIVKKKLRYLPIVNPEQQLMLSVLSQLDILGEGRKGGRGRGRVNLRPIGKC